MKKGIHPEVRDVAFKDVSCGHIYVIKSTLNSKETTTLDDGKEYPLVKVEISAASHPFFTGKHRIVDTEGRVDRFRKKYSRKSSS